MKYNYKKDNLLKKIKEIIITTTTPSRIILFGSRTQGSISKNSDYDILIIQKDLINERNITRRINREFFIKKIPIPIDLIAIDEQKWESDKDDIGLIYNKINSEGIKSMKNSD